MLHPAVGIAAVVCACLACTGCTADGKLIEPRKLFSGSGNGIGGEPDGKNWEKVKTPGTPKLPADHLETAERVELLVRRIIAQNAFTGLEPQVFMIDEVPELVLFHLGTQDLRISRSLVKKCKTEPELAAVLCTELGLMMAEKRGVRRVGGDRDTIPDSALPGGTNVGGGIPADPAREAEIAFHERRHPRLAGTADPDNPAKLSRELLKGAGFDPAEYDRVEPLVRQSKRSSSAIQKQMIKSAEPPKWDP